MGTVKRKRPHKGFIVAIDGPAGAGKSTVSRHLAEELAGMLLDTGGMYRGVAFFALQNDIKIEEELATIAKKLEFDVDPDSKTLLIDQTDLGTKIRTIEVSEMASKISRFRQVRKILTQKQRTLAKRWSKHFPVVVEGRDIGTVVFPKVPFKFYVTADPSVRAKRRLTQLKKQGKKGLTLKAILRQNEERDTQDSSRKIAPLKCPEDAVIVDTSSLAISQVVHFMKDHIEKKLSLPNIDRG